MDFWWTGLSENQRRLVLTGAAAFFARNAVVGILYPAQVNYACIFLMAVSSVVYNISFYKMFSV